MSLLRIGSLVGATALLTAAAQAQLVLGGSLSDSTTGPLLAGVVYHVPSGVSINTGDTLTIQAGAKLKFGPGAALTVAGVLHSNGTGGAPVYMTSLKDDTVGGDTNGDGASSGAPGDWTYVRFLASSAGSSLQNTIVRYAGNGGWSPVRIESTIGLANCTVENGSNTAIDLTSSLIQPTITGCTLRNNSGWAIGGARFSSLANVSSNSATGNGVNGVLVNDATVSVDSSVSSAAGVNGVLSFLGSVNVPSGRTLALGAGVILKSVQGGGYEVNGALLANGTAGQPVVLTSFADDAYGGDTNNDGPSAGTPGSWPYVRFYSTASASHFTHAVVRFAGQGGWRALRFDASSPTIQSCTIEESGSGGANLVGPQSHPTITGCLFRNNAGWAIDGAAFESLVNLSNNSATGNGVNGVLVTQPAVSQSTAVSPDAGINGTVCFTNAVNVPANLTLTLDAGLILKSAQGAGYEIAGTLVANGSTSQPVVFTSFADDFYGGDTNTDGPSSGSPGAWPYMRFYSSSSASQLTHAVVRFAGQGGWRALRFDSASPTIQGCTIESSATSGADLVNAQSRPTITGCTFRNNAGWAIDGAAFESLANVSNNTATGNGVNGVLVTSPTLATDTTVRPTSGFGGVVAFNGAVNVPSGRTLTLEAGVVLKSVQNGGYEISGALVTNGTTSHPVVFTAFEDDVHGGDTNNDGVSSGTPGDWPYMRFYSSASASRLVGAIVRYGGQGGWTPLRFDSSSPTVRFSVVEFGLGNAISLANSAARPVIDRCLIRNNGGYAITDAQIGAVPYLTRNNAVGNGANQLRVTGGTLTEDLYIDGNSGINSVVVLASTLTAPVGLKLTLGPGLVLKFASGLSLTVNGALDVIATRERPLVLTAETDDAIGGNSNGVPSVATPGHWLGMYFESFAAPSNVENVLLRFAGLGGFSACRALSPVTSFERVRIERSAAAGFELHGAARADYLTAWSCATTGVSLHGGNFDVRHATAAGCLTGIHRQGAAWSGRVVDSIATDNTTNFSNLTNAFVSYSNGFTGGGAGNLNLGSQFVDVANGDLHLLPTSPCLDAGDPASPRDGDCTRADMGAYSSATAPELYCVGKTNSNACTPYLGYSGLASASSPLPFNVRAYNVLNNKNGLFFYGFSGRTSAPFQGGLKCVADPVRRSPLQDSLGNPNVSDCSGVYVIDFNALIQAGGDPFLVPGASVFVQGWHRDPAVPSATGLTDALEFAVCN